uniref:Type II methyltransferase M.TaqI-like domain-containing protein n=1 Tax=viral metagenome TaxID=1070528 RepID=A0A6C0IC99_9ZZZZ
MEKANKKKRGQFYTTQSSYILEGFPPPPHDVPCIVEPFAGKGDLIDWVRASGSKVPLVAYDIEPKRRDIQLRDTLADPPDYENAWIITNPPYLARNKSSDKTMYDRYDTNDLYKCFLTSLTQQGPCRGGIFILPAGFFFSPREVDVRCRDEFMTRYRITKVKYFEESVFEDTTTTIVAFSFEFSNIDLKEQTVEWVLMPSKQHQSFTMSFSTHWIVGGDIYHLPIPEGIKVRRHVQGQKLRDREQQTHITLHALDSGTQEGRICLTYDKEYIYPAKECSRSYATFRITGKCLSEKEQIELCAAFNEFLEQKRRETWSLFLPQYRESKEYARKRIPFELAYRIFLHLLL